MKFGIRVALQTLSTNPTRLQIGLNIYYFRVKNRIENASIDFAINSIRADHVRADQVVEWAKKNILEVLDKNASLLIDPETIVTIPDLNIHIELSIDEDLFSASDKVQEVINQKVKKALYEALNEHRSSKIPVERHRFNLILEYLMTGQVNRFQAEPEWQSLVDNFITLLTAGQEGDQQLTGIIKDKNAFYRFYRLIGQTRFNDFLKLQVKEQNLVTELRLFIDLLNQNPKVFSPLQPVEFYYQIFLRLAESGKSLPEALQQILVEYAKNPRIDFKKLTGFREIRPELQKWLIKSNQMPLQKSNVRPEENTEELRQILPDGAFVGQAGLVLLAVFLPDFLKRLNYLHRDGDFINREEIPILLHYLATGTTEAPEWQLTLPKVLAGLKPGQHCNTKIIPDRNLIAEVEKLLQSVIKNWSALKNTSPDGLRNTFLIREGLLKYKNGFYYLYLQEQTVDILLSYVSWNYRIIKLNWMPQILFVEWSK